MDAQALLDSVTAIEPQATLRPAADRPAVAVPADRLAAFMGRLKEAPLLAFDLLYTHTAVDWPAEDRIELLYVLYSTRQRHSLLVSASVPRSAPEIDSVHGVWRIAEWQEREVYDLFGVLYRGHPDLRRILLPDEWQGHPLLKDYRDDHMLELPK